MNSNKPENNAGKTPRTDSTDQGLAVPVPNVNPAITQALDDIVVSDLNVAEWFERIAGENDNGVKRGAPDKTFVGWVPYIGSDEYSGPFEENGDELNFLTAEEDDWKDTDPEWSEIVTNLYPDWAAAVFTDLVNTPFEDGPSDLTVVWEGSALDAGSVRPDVVTVQVAGIQGLPVRALRRSVMMCRWCLRLVSM